MSGSDRADGQTGAPREAFSMPRDYAFESGKEKRRDRDVFSRRLSSTISLDGAAIGGPPTKRRGGGGELLYSGRSGGASCNGWHDDVASRSKSFPEPASHTGNSTGRVGPPSPRHEFNGADGSPSPKDLDGYRFSKPGSPLFMQSRISSMAQVSHHGYSGKGILGREHSRCSEWDYPYKVDMEYRDKIWGRSDLHKRTGISYDTATTPNIHKDGEPRREQEGNGGSGDSTGGSSSYIRSYQEWRQGDRMASSHGSANGYLKESAARVQGFSDVLGSWHSPLSSPVNYMVDGGRDDGNQMSPRKRPRLGWGQGLAKYEKKITGGADDSLGTKGRGISCPEEISSCIESPHQGTGQVQTVSSAKAVSDGAGNPCSEADKDIHTMQMDQKIEAPGIDNIIEKSKEFGSMPAPEIGRLESCQSLDTPIESKECESTGTLLQLQPQVMVLDQCSSLSSWSKSNILQRLEKLELELELTEKELAKFEVHPGDHLLLENDHKISDTRDSEAVQVQLPTHTIEHKEAAGEVLHALEGGLREDEVMDEQRERPFSGICETSLCEVAVASNGDSKMHVSSEAWNPSCYSLHTASVISKGDDGLVEANQCDLQGSCLKERSLSAGSFSELDRMTGVTHSGINSESLLVNGEVQLGSIYGALSIKDNNKCWRDLYDQNLEQAKCASRALASLLPDSELEAGMVSIGKCKQMQSPEDSREGKLKIKQQLQDMLLQKKMSLRFRELVLALKYRALRETWKREQAGICQWNDRTECVKKLDIERKNGTQVPSQRTSHRLRLSVSGIAKVDAVSDELQTMQKLLAEPFGGYHRPHLKMPSQILDEKERNIQRFISNNALIEDPVAFEQERKTINPWTPEEKKIFLEKFFLFNKNFQKIASFIEHKTVADCIEFYYRNQKSEEFEMMRRRQQLKNRRDYSRPFSYLEVNTTPPNSRRREVSTICVDKLPIPSTTALCNADGRAFCRDLSKNVQSSHIASVDSNNLENPPVNSGSVSGINITTEESDKFKTVESSQSPRSIIEEFDSQWTDNERQHFVIALGMFGKDFKNISQHVATKSEGQCKAFFSKTRKRLGLDQVLETFEMNIHENLGQAEEHREDRKNGASVEHSKCVETDHVPTDNDDVNGDSICDCLPLDPAVVLEEVSLKSTEEPLTMLRSSGNGEKIQNMEDERPLVSVPEVTDCLPKNTEERVPSNDIEEQTEGIEQNIPVALTETLCAPKEEKTDPLGILTDPSSEPGSEVVHAGNSTLQEVVYRDEQLHNLISSKSGEENEAQVSAPRVDMLEKPAVEDIDLQADSANHTLQDCPDLTQTSHSSSSQTYLEPVLSNVSTVTCTAQPRSKGNPNGGESKPRREATSWTQDEKEKFVEILRKHGRDWSLLQDNLPLKSLTQIKTYFQNSKAKLGLTAAEGNQSRSAPNRKPKMDDSDSMNSSYRVPHHKVPQLSEEAVLKSDQTVNGSINTILSVPCSDSSPFAFYPKAGWQAEDPIFNGMQKMFQQMNGQFPVQPSVIMGSGFHQSQNHSMQQSLSLSTSNSQPVNPQQIQQIAGLPQLQSSSASCNLQSQILNQIKQQQITSQVIPQSQQDYQGIQKLQLIMQQQAVQSFQQNISTSVLQQQQSPQSQGILHQQNQQQHLNQSPHLVQHARNQNLHYLQQPPPIQSLGELAAVASQQVSSNHLKVINQQQLPSQQQLMNQFQLHYDDQKNYHLLQSSHVSHQEQHSMLGSSSHEQLQRQLLYHQLQLQSEKQPEPLRMILPMLANEISEVSHHHQGQAPDIISGKEQKQWQDLHNCQSIMLHKGANQSTINDSPNIHDSIELKNVLKSQTHETGHLPESQVNLQVRASPQLKPGSTSESHQTRAGDVKLFGQFLLSQPTSSLNSTASASEGVFSKPMFSLSSTPVSHVEASISEGLPYTYPDGTPCLPSGFGRIGLSFSQGQCHYLPGQSTSAVSPVLRNNILDGREHACLAQATESENDTQNSRTAITRMIQQILCEGKEYVGEQSKRVLDGQIPVMGFGFKRQGDQGNSPALSTTDITAINSDFRSNVPCISSITDFANLRGRRKDVDLSSTMGAILASTRRQGSRDLCYAGGHSSEELHRSRDSPGNNVCHAVSASKSIVTNAQMATLAQSFAVGVETSQVTRDNSFLGQQGILYGSGSGGLVPTVSSVWPHGPVIVEGQLRAEDSKNAEEKKRQPT